MQHGRWTMPEMLGVARRGGAGALALALVLAFVPAGLAPANAAAGECTLQVDRHYRASDVRGLFGGPDCRASWVFVDFLFAPESVTGSDNGSSFEQVRRDIEVWTNRTELPWPIALGWWGTERLALRVSDGGMVGGVDLATQEDVNAAISGESAGTPVTVSLTRRDMPDGARSIRDWNLGDGRCQIGSHRIDVTFNYRAEWPESQVIDEVADLRSITVTNDRLYGPLCLALVLATPLPD